MTLSLLLAWITVFLLLITAFKYIARISRSAKLNRFFHKLHIPVGVLLIVTGLMHGLLAGNFADTSISDIRIGEVLLSFNWGTLCFILSVLLALSYLCSPQDIKEKMDECASDINDRDAHHRCTSCGGCGNSAARPYTEWENRYII